MFSTPRLRSLIRFRSTNPDILCGDLEGMDNKDIMEKGMEGEPEILKMKLGYYDGIGRKEGRV